MSFDILWPGGVIIWYWRSKSTLVRRMAWYLIGSADLLSIRSSGTNINEIWIKAHILTFKKVYINILSENVGKLSSLNALINLDVLIRIDKSRGPHFNNKKDGLSMYWNFNIKIRQSWDRLIFMLEISIPVWRPLYIETIPWYQWII